MSKEVAALNFLSNIDMEREEEIVNANMALNATDMNNAIQARMVAGLEERKMSVKHEVRTSRDACKQWHGRC